MNDLMLKLTRVNTVEKLQRHLANPLRVIADREYKDCVPRVVCGNDMSVSVQASSFNYAQPRDNHGPWTHIELGYPSECPPEPILKYVEDRDNPTNTVYAYVPIELVAAWIDSCGGMTNLPQEYPQAAKWELEDNNDN